MSRSNTCHDMTVMRILVNCAWEKKMEENKLENQFFILETAEVALIGLFSLVSEKISDLQCCCCCEGFSEYLLYHPLDRGHQCWSWWRRSLELQKISQDSQHRCSSSEHLPSHLPHSQDHQHVQSSRKCKSRLWKYSGVQIFATIFALSHDIWILVKCQQNDIFYLQIETVTKTVASFECGDQLLYCIFVYLMVLCLVKPLVWPRLRFDYYIYFTTTIPPALIAIIR